METLKSYKRITPEDREDIAVYYLHFHLKGGLQKLALQELRQKGKKRTKRSAMIDRLEYSTASEVRKSIEKRLATLKMGCQRPRINSESYALRVLSA